MAPYGISGFHDHLVTHAVVKRAFLQLRDDGADYLKRLALTTMLDDGSPSFRDGFFRMAADPGRLEGKPG